MQISIDPGCFTQVKNQILTSKNISFAAKGLYTYMLSKPSGWDFAAERIAEETSDGVDSIRSMLRELIDYGVLQRKRLKTGKFEYILMSKVKAFSAISLQGKKPRLNNIEKEVIDTVASDDAVVPTEDTSFSTENRKIKGLIHSFASWNPAASRWYANKTQREACSILLKNYEYDLLTIIIRVYLPLSNKLEYVKTITTPLKLLDAIATYSDSLAKNDFFEVYKAEIAEGIKKINEFNQKYEERKTTN